MGCISGLMISIYNPHVQLQVKVYKVQLQGEGGFYYNNGEADGTDF